MNKINKVADKPNAPSSHIKACTPRYYLGFTCNYPVGNRVLRVRLTFMEKIDDSYVSIEKLIGPSYNYRFPDVFVTGLTKLVKSLWRFGISHNDLSIRNLLFNITKYDIKLIDFGLAELIHKRIEGKDDDLEKRYEEYYTNIEKDEQDGSNVQKLHELVDLLRQLSSGKPK